MKHKFQNLMNEAEEAKKARRLLDKRLDRILLPRRNPPRSCSRLGGDTKN